LDQLGGFSDQPNFYFSSVATQIRYNFALQNGG
jgi:hypothetical protein